MFERQGDSFPSWSPSPEHARHAFGAFRVFAGREVAAADVDEADGLLYQFGPFGTSGSEGEPVFRLSFVRQVATDAEGGLAQIECCLDYAMTAELGNLGAFHSWWFPEEGTARDAWFAGLAERPEWQLMDKLSPASFRFGVDEMC